MVTEFHYHEHDSFSIDVQLFDENELLDQLRPLLSIYRQARLYTDDTQSQADREDLETRAVLAEDTFASMFHGSPLLDQSFLLNEDENVVLGRFRLFITNKIPTITNGFLEGLTMEDCIHQLSRLSCDPAGDELANWPYIRKIRQVGCYVI